jgi:peptidoglycan/LPS O-acetylase OafA/YrhL
MGMNKQALPAQTSTRLDRPKRYRPEIDGLRAFAVVAVIINHFNKNILPSGYLGVDVFFVISGYVITSSLAGRESKDFGDFIRGFYERRIKRLVPALVVFVLITSIFICMFNPEPKDALGIGLKALFGVSNISLYRASTDYFAKATELNPFMHTWSLGVEEQFYLLFPFLVWFSGFGKQLTYGARNLFLWVAGLSIASLVGFIYLYQTNQPAAYFLMPTRFWEMAAGCLLFIGFLKKERVEQQLERIPPLLVISAMVGVMFFPLSAAVPATILIVALSSILIACLKSETLAYPFFTNKRVVYIGLISYSLYLWHWSILSLSRWSIGIHWWSVPIQVLVMYYAAVASYKYLEKPIRTGGSNLNNLTVIAFGTILLAVSAFLLHLLNKELALKLYQGTKKVDDVPQLASGKNLRENCYQNEVTASEALKNCKLNFKNSTNTLWLVGDSHAETLLAGAEYVANNIEYNLFAFFFSATAFPPIKYYRTDFKDYLIKAYPVIDGIQKEIAARATKNDIVLVGMRMPYHFGNDGDQFPMQVFRYYSDNGSYEQMDSKEFYLKQWLQKMGSFLESVEDKGVKVIVLTPTPEFYRARLGECHEQNTYWFNKLQGKDCSIAKSVFIGRGGSYENIISNLISIQERNSNFFVFDAFSVLCPKASCSYSLNGTPLYRDADHMTNHASRNVVAPKLLKFIRERVLANRMP